VDRLPSLEKELRIVRTRIPGSTSDWRREVTAFIHSLRRMKLAKVPGVAESLDWAQALVALHATHLDEELVRETLGCFLKDEEDLRTVSARLDAGELAALSRRGMSASSGTGRAHRALLPAAPAQGLPLGPGTRSTRPGARLGGSAGPGGRPAGAPHGTAEAAGGLAALRCALRVLLGRVRPGATKPSGHPADVEKERESRAAASQRKRSVESWQELEELAVPPPAHERRWVVRTSNPSATRSCGR
jgi:hypothetical protein